MEEERMEEGRPSEYRHEPSGGMIVAVLMMLTGLLACVWVTVEDVYRTHLGKSDDSGAITEKYESYEEREKRLEEEREDKRISLILSKTELVSEKLGFPIEVVVHSNDTEYGEAFFTPTGVYKAVFDFREENAELVSVQKVEDYLNK